MSNKENKRYEKNESEFDFTEDNPFKNKNVTESTVNIGQTHVENGNGLVRKNSNKTKNLTAEEKNYFTESVGDINSTPTIKHKSTLVGDFRFSTNREESDRKKTNHPKFVRFLKYSLDAEVQAEIDEIKLKNTEINLETIYCDQYRVSKINDIRHRFEITETDEVQYKKLEQIMVDRLFYRKCLGDGNCFYRAFMFCYFENLILQERDTEMSYFINFFYKNCHTKFPTNDFKINKQKTIGMLLILLKFIREDTVKAYNFLIYLFNFHKDFDLVQS